MTTLPLIDRMAGALRDCSDALSANLDEKYPAIVRLASHDKRKRFETEMGPYEEAYVLLIEYDRVCAERESSQPLATDKTVKAALVENNIPTDAEAYILAFADIKSIVEAALAALAARPTEKTS